MLFDNLKREKVSKREGYLCFFLFRLSKFSCTYMQLCALWVAGEESRGRRKIGEESRGRRKIGEKSRGRSKTVEEENCGGIHKGHTEKY
jgi:hypothetical protein